MITKKSSAAAREALYIGDEVYVCEVARPWCGKQIATVIHGPQIMVRLMGSKHWFVVAESGSLRDANGKEF